MAPRRRKRGVEHPDADERDHRLHLVEQCGLGHKETTLARRVVSLRMWLRWLHLTRQIPHELTTLVDLPKGTRLKVGDQVLLEVTQIGKTCHSRCAIYYQVGDCVMPREGIFAQVLTGGSIRPGDPITVLLNDK